MLLASHHIRQAAPSLEHLAWRLVAHGLMGRFLVVEAQVSADAGLGFGPILLSLQAYFLVVFHVPPQPLNEDVIHTPPLAIHADLDTLL